MTISTKLSPSVTTGDPVLLGQLVRNLVDNAIVHNMPDGWITISTATTGDTALIRVTNSGTIIAPDDANALFEPFRRNRQDRTRDTGHQGFGLGLAIAAVTTAHGGTISAVAREQGGLDITATFPTRPHQNDRHGTPESTPSIPAGDRPSQISDGTGVSADLDRTDAPDGDDTDRNAVDGRR